MARNRWISIGGICTLKDDPYRKRIPTSPLPSPPNVGPDVLILVLELLHQFSEAKTSKAIQGFRRDLIEANNALVVVINAGNINVLPNNVNPYYTKTFEGQVIMANYILTGEVPQGSYWSTNDIEALKTQGDYLLANYELLLKGILPKLH